jgi:hypothetical protein
MLTYPSRVDYPLAPFIPWQEAKMGWLGSLVPRRGNPPLVQERAAAPSQPPSPPNRVQVFIPGATNYYYDLEGRRLAEACHELGIPAKVATLADHDGSPADLSLFVNLYEVVVGHGDQSDALERIRQVIERSPRTVMVLLECVHTNWFQESLTLCRQTGIKEIWDMGLASQEDACSSAVRPMYRFLPSGLLASERQAMLAMAASEEPRPIPWAFVGSLTRERVLLVENLVRKVDPRGFLFMRSAKPVRADGPDINEEQLHQVLRRTKYHVWCAHHAWFYMESQRFRQALLSGAVPIKVVHAPRKVPSGTPLASLLLDASDLDRRLRMLDFQRARQDAADELCRFPSLPQGLSEAIAA